MLELFLMFSVVNEAVRAKETDISSKYKFDHSLARVLVSDNLDDKLAVCLPRSDKRSILTVKLNQYQFDKMSESAQNKLVSSEVSDCIKSNPL